MSILIADRCLLRGQSERTSASYGNRVAAFEDWAGQSAMEASPELVAAWMEQCARSGASAETLFQNRSALAYVFRELRGEELDPQIVPVCRRTRRADQIAADPWAVATILAAIGDPRIRLFCQFVYGTGMRRREAMEVRAADLDPARGTVLVRIGKGRRQRHTILPASLVGLIREHRVHWCGEGRLFTADGSADGPPLSFDRINGALQAARLRTGVADRITLHQLRRCFATHLHERGVGLVELQRLLGHGSVISTLRYIGLREARRGDIARIGDLLAALPAPAAEQQRIAFAP